MNEAPQKSPAKLLSVLAATLLAALAVVVLIIRSDTAPSKVATQPQTNAASVVTPQKSPEERRKKCRESILANAHSAMAAKEFEKAVAILDNGERLCVGLLQDEEFLALHAQAEKEDQRAAPVRQRQRERTEAIALAEGRRKIAAALRQRWLDHGVNIKVRVSGKQAAGCFRRRGGNGRYTACCPCRVCCQLGRGSQAVEEKPVRMSAYSRGSVV